MNIPVSDTKALLLLKRIKGLFNDESTTVEQLLSIDGAHGPVHDHIDQTLTPLTSKLSTASYTHSFAGYVIETIKLLEATSIERTVKIRDLILPDSEWINCQDAIRRAISNQVGFCLTYLDGLNQGKQ